MPTPRHTRKNVSKLTDGSPFSRRESVARDGSAVGKLLRLRVVFTLHRLRYQHARRHFAHGRLGA